MNCPTCSAEMGAAGLTASSPGCHETLYWCSRCGSLVDDDGQSAPDIVRRCRELALLVPAGTLYEQDWQRVGLNDALYPKEQACTPQPPPTG